MNQSTIENIDAAKAFLRKAATANRQEITHDTEDRDSAYHAIEDANRALDDALTTVANTGPWVRWDGVTEQCWWWWFDGENPVPVSILYSRTVDKFFASVGQLGWNQPQNVEDMGGWWMKILEPDATGLAG